MLKIRLHGELDEMEQYVETLKKVKNIKILSISNPYKDRGKVRESEYSRIYIDVQLEKLSARKK